MAYIFARLVAAIPFALAFGACAGERASDELKGVLTHRACPSNAFYSDLYATLLLDEALVVEGVGQVDSVELILPEHYFVSYGKDLGERVVVTCQDLGTSSLCGPRVPRASCGVTRLRIAP